MDPLFVARRRQVALTLGAEFQVDAARQVMVALYAAGSAAQAKPPGRNG